jgi:hypothetical protein
MINKQQRAVVQQALEALENRCGMDAEEREELMPALRQLLEKPEPVQDSEQFDLKLLDDLKKLMGLPPYNESSNTAMGDGYFSAHLIRTHGKEKFDAAVAYLRSGATSTPPAQPAAWVGLTDEEIAEAGQLTVEGPRMLPYAFARAIEAKLKEKNT